MNTALIGKSLLAIGTTVGAFAWGPGALETTRDYMIEPAMQKIDQQIQSQTINMAGMKYYDIRTDELAEDVKRLQSRISRAQGELARVPASSSSYRQHLEALIREAEQELRQKQKMLDQATSSDRGMLSLLQGSTV